MRRNWKKHRQPNKKHLTWLHLTRCIREFVIKGEHFFVHFWSSVSRLPPVVSPLSACDKAAHRNDLIKSGAGQKGNSLGREGLELATVRPPIAGQRSGQSSRRRDAF